MQLLESWSSVTIVAPQKQQHVVKSTLPSLDEFESLDIKNLDIKVLNSSKSFDRFWKIISGKKSKFMH